MANLTAGNLRRGRLWGYASREMEPADGLVGHLPQLRGGKRGEFTILIQSVGSARRAPNSLAPVDADLVGAFRAVDFDITLIPGFLVGPIADLGQNTRDP